MRDASIPLMFVGVLTARTVIFPIGLVSLVALSILDAVSKKQRLELCERHQVSAQLSRVMPG